MRKLDKCPLCGGKMEDVVVRYLERYREDIGLILFADVPAERCVDCGERYYSADISLAMDRVIQKRLKAAKKMTVPVFPVEEILAANRGKA